MKRAIVRIPTLLVHDLLVLPADVEIVGFLVEPDRDGIMLRLKGESLPKFCEVNDDPGWRIPEVACAYESRTVIVDEFKGFS